MMPPAATTCAISWMEPPAHIPAVSEPRPSRFVSSGTRAIISVPKITTRATAVMVSSSASSSGSVTPAAPATAAAPQMENPQAMSSESPDGTRSSLPRRTVPSRPPATMHTTTTSIGAPRSRMSVSTSWSPRKTMPARRSFFAEKSMPSEAAAGSRTTLARSTPSTIAIMSGLTPGSSRLTPYDAPAAARQRTSPGRSAQTRASSVCSGRAVAMFCVCVMHPLFPGTRLRE